MAVAVAVTVVSGGCQWTVESQTAMLSKFGKAEEPRYGGSVRSAKLESKKLSRVFFYFYPMLEPHLVASEKKKGMTSAPPFAGEALLHLHMVSMSLITKGR